MVGKAADTKAIWLSRLCCYKQTLSKLCNHSHS